MTTLTLMSLTIMFSVLFTAVDQLKPSEHRAEVSSTENDRTFTAAPRAVNIVFAHDPGAGHYDGVVGGPNDIWNFVDLGTTAVDFTRHGDATPSTARLRITRHDGEWGITGQSGVFHGYIYHNCRCVDLETKILDLPAGQYMVYVFAHGDAPDQNAELEVRVGDRSMGRKETVNDGSWSYRTEPLTEGLQYVSFKVKLRNAEDMSIISHRTKSGYSMLNAIQIVPVKSALTRPSVNSSVKTSPQLE